MTDAGPATQDYRPHPVRFSDLDVFRAERLRKEIKAQFDSLFEDDPQKLPDYFRGIPQSNLPLGATDHFAFKCELQQRLYNTSSLAAVFDRVRVKRVNGSEFAGLSIRDRGEDTDQAIILAARRISDDKLGFSLVF